MHLKRAEIGLCGDDIIQKPASPRNGTVRLATEGYLLNGWIGATPTSDDPVEETEPQLIDRNPDAMPSLLGLGRAWSRVGYGVLLLTALAFLALILVHPVFGLPPGGRVPEGYKLVAGKDLAKDGGMVVRASTLGFFSIFLVVFSALAGLVWTLVDVVDRRKRFVWLLPMFVCPFVGLQLFPLALYLFYGRETRGHGEDVQ